MTAHESCTSESSAVQLKTEDVAIALRRVVGDTVRVSTETTLREHLIDEELHHERVEVERVAIGRYVDAVPPVREEGDTTIISVVEEVLVLERRLVLKEEVRIRRVRVTDHHRETVTLRSQRAVVTRDPPPPAGQDCPSAETTPIPAPQEITR